MCMVPDVIRKLDSCDSIHANHFKIKPHLTNSPTDRLGASKAMKNCLLLFQKDEMPLHLKTRVPEMAAIRLTANLSRWDLTCLPCSLQQPISDRGDK